MEMPSLRVRLVFEDRSILSRTQRSDGLNQSLILLKSQQHQTISDVCTHLLHIFKLHRSCPNGILLSMDGFVLPPFESTEILKDKEIIGVRKKGGATSDAVEAADAGNLLDEVEVDGSEPEDNGLLLLANDKFDKGIGEYQSESEEVDEEQSQDEASPGEAVSKKRKASMKLQNSKKKKRCLRVLDDAEDEADTEEIDDVNNDASRPRKIGRKKIPNCNSKPNAVTKRSAATSNKNVKSPSIVKRSEQLQENVEEVNQVSTAPGAKKIPSRSARRKKAKRQWMRELAKISKKKPHPHTKPEVTKAENKEASGPPKGLVHWKQAAKKPVHKNTIEQETNQNGDVGTGVPIVSRPRHIRFEPLDEDQAAKQTGVSNETLKWNGSSSKRKGQKRGTEKFSTFRRNDSKRINKKSFKMLITDMQVPVIDPNDFDKLPPCSSPKEGDVIAYRLLELSSSWTPEYSSFRVGRISYYDAKDIVLIPVPEYPIVSDKMDEDGPNDSPYGEDGTLEINYSALVDVRNLKEYDPDATEAVSNGVNQTPLGDDKDTAENLVSNSNDSKTTASKDSNPGDGEVNPWDRFSKLKSVDTEMAEPNQPSMVGSGMNPSAAPDADKAVSSEEKDEQIGSCLGNPWLNANKPEHSQENEFHTRSSWAGWTDTKKAGPSENDNEKGSSWGRPWSSFAPLRGNSIKEQNKENDWNRGSSRGNGKPWSRGSPRGRGRGRGRGGRNARMM